MTDLVSSEVGRGPLCKSRARTELKMSWLSYQKVVRRRQDENPLSCTRQSAPDDRRAWRMWKPSCEKMDTDLPGYSTQLLLSLCYYREILGGRYSTTRDNLVLVELLKNIRGARLAGRARPRTVHLGLPRGAVMLEMDDGDDLAGRSQAAACGTAGGAGGRLEEEPR